MKKIILAAFAALLTASLTLSLPAWAATNDFTASANITVSGVTIGTSGTATVGMFIANGSTSESWSFNSGTFSVTNPGSFSVGSSDPGVLAIKINLSGSQVSCNRNTTPGTTTVALPTTSGTYTVVPSATECTGSGGGGSTGGGGGGGGGGGKYQKYNPKTGELTTDATPASAVETTPASTTPAPATTTTDSNLASVKSEAANIAGKTRAEVAQAAGKAIDTAKESEYNTSIVSKIIAGQTNVESAVKEKILTFVTYGGATTDYLGAGERGGVVNSFKEAFGKLPQTDTEWEDVVKIANGRWPGQTNKTKEDKATLSFKSIYKRLPDRSNPKDDAAVVVMTYGLRPRNRNLNSEKAAIKSYRAVFGRSPVTATAWDAVRAIAYSGAKR